MKTRTIHLPVVCGVPGMTLALAITDRAERTLFAAGTVLDADILGRLNKRGIEAAAVLVTDTRNAATIEAELIAARTRTLQIFRGTGTAARDALQAAILDHREASAR